MESDLSRDFDRKNDAALATRDFDRAGRSLDPSVSSTMAAKAASSNESLRFFSFERCNAKSKENLRRGLSARSIFELGVRASAAACLAAAMRWSLPRSVRVGRRLFALQQEVHWLRGFLWGLGS